MNTLIGFVGFLIVILLIGFLFEQVAAWLDRTRYKQPAGKRIDIGTHHLHLHVLGDALDGKPTIVFDHGIGSNSLDWQRVHGTVAEYGRAVVYDRAGYGWSERGPEPRTPQQIVTELHDVLQKAEIFPPYILVGHSFGGIHVRLYAERFPDEVAGVILVDSSHPEMIAERDTKPELRRLRNVALFKRIGLVRLMLPRLLDRANRLPTAARKQYLAMNLLDSDNVIREAEPLFSQGIDLPARLPEGTALTVISRAFDEDLSAEMKWDTYQKKLTRLTDQARHIHADTSSHFIALADPETVIRAIRDMVDELAPTQESSDAKI